MFWKKRYIGERFPLRYRFQGECYYISRCPAEEGNIEKKRSLRMRLVYGKRNDRYIRCYTKTPKPKARKKARPERKS